MNKQFVISVVVVFFMLMIFGYTVHGVLLNPDYQQVSSLYRSPEEQMQLFPLMLPAHILAAFAFVWLYTRTMRAGPPLMQGIAFGLAIAALMIVHKFVIYYTLQPIPGFLATKQILFDAIAVILMGIAVAYINAGRARGPGAV